MRLFRIPALWLIPLFIVFSISGIAQQETPEDWYYAVQLPGGRLVSFNLDGEVRTLLGKGFDRAFGREFEIAPNEFINASTYADELHIFHVTPERLRTINTGNIVFEELDFFPLTASYPYVVLVNPQFGFNNAVLVNVHTLQAEALPRMVPAGLRPGCCRFSDDGQFLRYFSADDDTGETVRLIEHTLATGDEREIAVLPGSRFLIYQVSAEGSLWLYRTSDETLLINIDGSQRILESRTEDGPISQLWSIFGDRLYSQDMLCEEDCELLLYDGFFPLSYLVPPQMPMEVMHKYSDSSLLARSSGETYMLRSDFPPQYLGLISGGGISFVSLSRVSLTDNHKLVVMEDEEANSGASIFKVFSLPDGKQIYRGTAEQSVLSVIYSEDGTYIQDFRDMLLLFPIDSDDVIVFPGPEQLDVLRIIAMSTEGGYFAYDREGIYLYDYETDQLETLLDGNWVFLNVSVLPH